MKIRFFLLLFAVFASGSSAEEITLSGFSGQKEWKKTGIVYRKNQTKCRLFQS